MKRIITLTLISLASLLSTASQAAKKVETNPFTVHVSPLGVANNAYSGGFDIGITEDVSIGIEGTYMSDLKAVAPKDSANLTKSGNESI